MSKLARADIQRRVVGGAVLVITAMIIAACSVPFLNQNSAPAQPAQVVATTATTRTLKHAFGETTVPAVPQRVVALGEDGLLVDLLDLGIKPVVSNVNIPEHLPLTQPHELAGIELFASSAGFSIEKLSAYQPDLIIGTRFFIEHAGYDNLSKIAPTVVLGGDDELEIFVELARVLSKEAEVQTEVDAFKRQLEAEAARVNAKGKALSVGTVYPEPSIAAWVGGPTPIPQLLLDLGFTLSPDAKMAEPFGVKNGRAFISPEKLDLFSADTLLLLQTASVEGELDAVEKVKANPLWARLPAVQANRVFTLDRIGYPGFRGLRQLLADVMKVVQT